MQPSVSGIIPASLSHTIGSLSDRRIFVMRSSADLITYDTIRRRSKTCSIPFSDFDVELLMRGYIGPDFKYQMGMIVAVGDLVMVHGRYMGWGLRPWSPSISSVLWTESLPSIGTSCKG